MNKQDFIDKISRKAGITKREAKESIDVLFEEITKALKKGQKVTFVGFGTFSTRRRKARKGRNPKTGATIKIAAKRVPKFSAGKALKESVR
ncbi:HU family DNA-binding protein [candidate division WOR-3 bacterium]|nr:HU family DNA-binding protein [candidate division WOR-3 bacterium]TET79301.1 MAG: HU family DNA-binding protein [Candidatus Cloacimonadota bacterium]